MNCITRKILWDALDYIRLSDCSTEMYEWAYELVNKLIVE